MSAKSHFTSFTSLSNNFSQVPLGILGLGQWQEDDEVNPGGTPCSRTISGSSEPEHFFDFILFREVGQILFVGSHGALRRSQK